VDIKNSNIHVKYTYDSNNSVLETPKNGSERHTYMQPELKDLCIKIKKAMLIQKLKYGYELEDYFFCGEDGKRMKYYSYNTYLKENSLRVLGREITTHVLRHTHGSLLLEQGIPVDVISRRLGHKDINITKRIYLHVTEKLKQKDNDLIHQIKIG
jgi:integrase